MTAHSKIDPASGSSVALWVGVLGGPVMWAIQLNIGYALAPFACGGKGSSLAGHLVTAVCLLLTLLGAYLSFRDWRAAGAGSPDETDGGPVARTRFLGALGVVVSLTFAVTIVAQGLAGFFLDGCWL